jgi:hypothetical protein
MTISSTTRIAGPFLSGTALPFTFKVFAAADLNVVRLNTSTGVETSLVLSSDYTVALNGNQNTNPGGTVNLTVAASATSTVTITSDIANLQPTDLTNQGGFYPEVITDSLDRATIQIQQMSEDIGRSLKGPISDGNLNMELPTAAVRASKYLVFDANGLPIPSAGSGTDSALRTDLANTGVTTAGAGLVGFRTADATSVGRTVLSKLRDVVSVKDFGAVGNGTADDTAAIQAAIAAIPTNGVLVFPQGTYRTTSTITVQKNMSWVMQGGGFVYYVTASNTPAVFFDYPLNNVDIVLGVQRATRNWSSGADGVVFVDMIDSRIEITSAINHRRGIALDAGTASGFGAGSIAYNKFTLGKVFDNKYGMYCDASGGAFQNTNECRGGRFTLTAGVSAAMTEEAFGIYHNAAGTATYFAPSLEGVGNATYKFVFTHFDTGAKWNTILQPYIETDPTSVIMRVSGNARYNRILGHIAGSAAVSVNVQVEEVAGVTNPGTNIIDWNTLDNVSLFRGGLQEVFPVTDVYSNTIQTSSGANGDLLVPGFIYQVRSTVSDDFRAIYQTGSNHYLSNGYLSLGDVGLGKFVDARYAKRFWLSASKVAGHGGTSIVFVVKAYDASGVIITSAGAVQGNVSDLDTITNFATNADYGGSYTVTSAVDSKCFFAVSSSVATVWVGVAPASGNYIGVSGISLKCDADVPPPIAYPDYRRVNATYMDLDEECVATSVPLGGVIKDGRAWRITQTAATSQGWWTAARLATSTTASASAGATAVVAAVVTGITAADVIGILLTETSTSTQRWHWTTVSSVAGSTVNFTALAIPAGYSAANGTSLLFYRMVAMPNNA